MIVVELASIQLLLHVRKLKKTNCGIVMMNNDNQNKNNDNKNNKEHQDLRENPKQEKITDDDE